MRISDIDYFLPTELIAQHPLEPRDSARLLVASMGSGESAESKNFDVEHKVVSDIVHYLRPGDVLVVNETRVMPSRLTLARASGGKVEVLLLEPLLDDDSEWEALIRPGRKMRAGETLFDGNGDEFAVVVGRNAVGDSFRIQLVQGDTPVGRRYAIEQVGTMPLPPYITTTLENKERYQTVYSNEAKSAAAPTAGLHFTPQLLAQIRDMGVNIVKVELVVGLDTFKPVESENPLEHVIHSEWYNVPEDSWRAVQEANRVIAVGTTSVRALESVATLQQMSGRTRLFITPGYEWKVVDVMMTNFHMPRTTLLLMVQAFVGEQWRTLYEIAIKERYRFLSFGDAMLLTRATSLPKGK